MSVLPRGKFSTRPSATHSHCSPTELRADPGMKLHDEEECGVCGLGLSNWPQLGCPPQQHSLALCSILVAAVLWGCVGCVYRPAWPCRDAANAKIGPAKFGCFLSWLAFPRARQGVDEQCPLLFVHLFHFLPISPHLPDFSLIL